MQNQEQYGTKPTESEIWEEAQCKVAEAIREAEAKTGFFAEGVTIHRSCVYSGTGKIIWQHPISVQISTKVKESVAP